MKTIEINLYKFDELSEDAKLKAVERLTSINVDFDWWDGTYEDAKNIGLEITSFDLDRSKHAKGEFNLAANEVAQNIANEHGEQCTTFISASNFMELWQPVFNEYMNEQSERFESAEAEDDLQELENDFLNSLLEDYANILQNESEYLQSEEAIIETIKANEYDFTESGEMY